MTATPLSPLTEAHTSVEHDLEQIQSAITEVGDYWHARDTARHMVNTLDFLCQQSHPDNTRGQ